MNRPELSVVIPALNERECLGKTVKDLSEVLNDNKIKSEIIIITGMYETMIWQDICHFEREHVTITVKDRYPTDNFGDAIRTGISYASGKYVTFVMADRSEDPCEVVELFWKIKCGYDCVLGNRIFYFDKSKRYPRLKKLIKRSGDRLISWLFNAPPWDWTNAFKIYRANVLYNLQPFESTGFEISLEIVLKTYLKGYEIETYPVTWYPREIGKSKFKLYQQVPGYLKVLYKCWRKK